MQPILEGKLEWPPARSRFAGVLQVLRFNWPWYGLAACCAVSAAVAGFAFDPPPWLAAGLGVVVVSALFWSFSSLLAAHYVFDRSPLYEGSWIVRKLPALPRNWVNLHAGFDETTALLEHLFPDRCRGVIDLYNPQLMTEASIARAQGLGSADRSVLHAEPSNLPLEDWACDALFLFFAAHEIRQKVNREAFFQELHRILRPGGYLVLVEFVRDGWNTLAFGPGAWHAYPPWEWRRLARVSGFELREEFSITPFVRVFLLRRPTG